MEGLESLRPENMKKERLEYLKNQAEVFENDVQILLGQREFEEGGKNSIRDKDLLREILDDIKTTGYALTNYDEIAEAAKRLGYSIKPNEEMKYDGQKWSIQFPEN